MFDEHGTEVRAETVDPSTIDDKKPKWETFKGAILEQGRLGEERQGLLDYQAKLDEARERLDRDDITAKELNEFDADLKLAMPNAVREKLGIEKPKAEAVQRADASAPVMPDGMENLMRQTGLGPSAPAPR